MSCSVALSLSESIDGISRRWRPQIRFERGAIDHIDRYHEQTDDVLLEANVFVDRALGSRLKLHQNVEIAIGPVVAPRNGAEHGSVRHAARAQSVLVTAKSGDGVLSVHRKNIAQGGHSRQTLSLQNLAAAAPIAANASCEDQPC